jgi:hypothetical protein
MMRLYLIGFLLLLLSCDYEPDKEFFKVVEPPDPTGITINLSQEDDTVYVFNNTAFTFNGEAGQRKIYRVEVYFDDKLITTLDDGETVFHLSAVGFDDGVYPLRIEMFTASGSGSLADRVEAEQFKITRQWIAYIDRTVPIPVLFKTVAPHDGTLRVSWQRYGQHNFQSYSVAKYWKNPYFNTYSQIWSRDITDQNLTWLDDDTYMGGGVRYEIHVVGGDQQSTKNQIDFHSVYDPAIAYTWVDHTHIKLMWHKAPFASNLTRYEISVAPEIVTNTVVTDTTTILDPGLVFGQEKQAWLKVYPHSDIYELSGVSMVNITRGKKIPKMLAVTYNKSLGKYFALQEDANHELRLIRLDGETMEIEQESSFQVYRYSISDNGQHLYVGWGGTLKKVNPLSFDVIDSFDYNVVTLAVSDNNLVTVWTGSATHVLKMPENTIVATFGNGTSSMSKSKYVLYGEQLYEWNGVALELKRTYAANVTSGLFVGDDKVILVYPDRFQTIDISAHATVSTISRGQYYVDYAEPPRYDPVSEYLGFFRTKPNSDKVMYYLYTLNNSVPTKSFELAASTSYPLKEYLIINNTLICSTGFQLPLSDF